MAAAVAPVARTDSRIPVTVLTGFLGSGKTTLLKRLLSSRGVRDVAVLVNEVAEVGIDQRLLDPIKDGVQVLENGCICCSVKEDLKRSLVAILDAPPPDGAGGRRFSRVVIETTGLADPAPILAVFASDPMLGYHFRVGAIVTTVDCVNAPHQLDHFREFANQVAAADQVVLTKADIAGGEGLDAAHALVARLNPAAAILPAGVDDEALVGQILGDASPSVDEAARFRRLIDAGLPARPIFREIKGQPAFHATPICIATDRPFDWCAFAVWLTMLLHAHGDNVLRVKGILNIAGSSTPVLINGIHRLMHQPEHLTRWPDGDRRSTIVLIVAGLAPEAIRRSFEALVA